MKLWLAGALMLCALIAAAPAQAKSPAQCGAKDRVETGLQGQIPIADRVTGRAAEGYNCNLDEVGSFASTAFANFDTYENCAYYSDTIGLYSAEGGTIVLDVSDPRKPVKTDYLTAGAAATPASRCASTASAGCSSPTATRSPAIGKLDDPDSRALAGGLRRQAGLPQAQAAGRRRHAQRGRPRGLLPARRDGLLHGAATDTITPIDLTRPGAARSSSPSPAPCGIHGCSTSDDGKRGYFADIGEGRMLIADTSEVQARKPGAKITRRRPTSTRRATRASSRRSRSPTAASRT